MAQFTHVFKGGYKRVSVALSRKNICRHKTVARLVLMAFIGPNPKGKQCCHNDGDSTNNALSNLRWDTTVNNIKDRVKHGTAGPKLNMAKVLEIRRLLNNSVPGAEIARQFTVSACHVSAIKHGNSWNYAPIEPNRQRRGGFDL